MIWEVWNMNRSIEKEGRTLEEATGNALKELVAKLEDVDIEVLDDGKAGFLGFGSRSARVRATLKVEAGLGEKEVGKGESEPLPAEDARQTQEMHDEEKIFDLGQARELLSNLIQRMHMNGTIKSQVRDGQGILNVIGEDSNLLIGKKGQTLDAIQYLLNLMYSKSTRKKAHIVVDVENYKVRRVKRLQSMAMEARDKVRQTKKPIAIAPMDAQDRRIIHVTLQNDEYVKTLSKGDGSLRKVVVIPK